MVIQCKVHGPLQRRPLHRHNSEQLPSLSHRRASLNLQQLKVVFAYEYEKQRQFSKHNFTSLHSVKTTSKSALFLFLHPNYPISPTPCFIPELTDTQNHQTRFRRTIKVIYLQYNPLFNNWICYSQYRSELPVFPTVDSTEKSEEHQ